MNKILIAVASLGISMTLIGTTAHSAFAAPAAAYRLVPATALPTPKTVLVSDTLWHCNIDSCTANQSTSRPTIICAQAARKVGKIESFFANGTAFDSNQLAKCNAKAKS